MTSTHPDQVRWFDPLGQCRACRKAATGKLMGPSNESYGAYCASCANKRLVKAKAEREKFAVEIAKMSGETT